MGEQENLQLSGVSNFVLSSICRIEGDWEII